MFQIKKHRQLLNPQREARLSCTIILPKWWHVCKTCQSQQSKELMYGKNPKPFFGISMDILPKTNSSPLQIGHPKRTLVFQPSIFRCYISFRGGNLPSRPDSLTPAARKGVLIYHLQRVLCTSHVVVLDFSHHQGHHHPHRPQPSLYFSWDPQHTGSRLSLPAAEGICFWIGSHHHLSIILVYQWCVYGVSDGVSNGNTGKLSMYQWWRRMGM